MNDHHEVSDLKGHVYDGDWDVLLILDACRYDAFERHAKSFLRGDLSKARSPGSSTPDFLDSTFDRQLDDTVYISANPFVTSEGDAGVVGPETFDEVVEVWAEHTDEALGAVTPAQMNGAILSALQTHESKRVIGHYIQPYIPFLTEGKLSTPENFILRDPNPDSVVGKLRNEIDNQLKSLWGKGNVWKLKRLFGLPPAADMEILLAEGGRERVQRAYERNLQAVLFAVHELCLELTGDVVVTADHGELLGEDGHYGHKSGSEHPALRTVPFFRINLNKTESMSVTPPDCVGKYNSGGTSKRDLSQRLKDLGYR